MILSGALSPFESQLVLLPLLLLVIVGLFALVITDLEIVIRRAMRVDELVEPVARPAKGRVTLEHVRDLESELFDYAAIAAEGER